jgi:undecaprenyl-diphosphatase
LLGLAAFLVLTLLVQLRALAGIDLALTRAVQPLVSPLLDRVCELVAIACSAELCFAYALVLAFALWRAGAGRWSLAPLSFLVLEGVEVVTKLTVDQPPVPSLFYRSVYYPLASVSLRGAYPSSHTARTAFLCLFLAVFLGQAVKLPSGLAALIALGPPLLCGFSRVYLGYHWSSDVVGGLILGYALAWPVANWCIRKLPGYLTPRPSPLRWRGERTKRTPLHRSGEGRGVR